MTISSLPWEVTGCHIFARLSIFEIRSFSRTSKNCASYLTHPNFISSWVLSASDSDISSLSTKLLQSCFAYLAPDQLFHINIEKLKALNVYALTESPISSETLLTAKILLEANELTKYNTLMPLMETLLNTKRIDGSTEQKSLLQKKLVDCNTSKPEILKKILSHLYLKTGEIKQTLDNGETKAIAKDSPFFEAFLEAIKTHLANDKPSQSIKILYFNLKNQEQVDTLKNWLETNQIAIDDLQLCFPYGINGTDTIRNLNTLTPYPISRIREYIGYCT